MSNQFFHELGLNLPTSAGASSYSGATTVTVVASGASFSRGDVVRLTYTPTVGIAPEKFKVEFAVTCAATAAGDAGFFNSTQIYAVALEDVTEDFPGLFLVRGACYALVDVVTTDIGMFSPMSNSIASTEALSHVADATSTHVVKTIALFTGHASETTTTETLLPVLFNGVEGFSTHTAA